MQAESEQAVADGAALLGTQLSALVERTFGTSFALLDGNTGEVLAAAAPQPDRDWALRAELCREVARRGRVEFIDEDDPLVVLALPLEDGGGRPVVAVGTFLARALCGEQDLARLAGQLGVSVAEASIWAERQIPWVPDALQRLGELVLLQVQAKRRIRDLEEEARSLSVHLASTYEEISLLYRLTQNLKISESDEDLGRVALEWMSEVLPAKGLAMQLAAVAAPERAVGHEVRTHPVLLTYGDCPLQGEQFTALVAHLGATASHRPVVVNRGTTRKADWPFPQIRQMIVVGLSEGENLFGHLAALNHVEDREFGTVEANLLHSVAAILGIHSGNIELYRQQSELLSGIVRALTSAIDAKDPYTCGHSDRVARVAVRLAEELGCDRKTLETLYLSGLLHDIGKIGIDDSVLRKPGRLSEAEYEHIKRHVEIGHRILRDLGKLEDVLPVVLHHHESWDGGGYPHRLNFETIPLPARIVAVADAYDAMGSDRPYRKAMPDEKIDEIFRDGAGRQWDPQVVEVFFRIREEIRALVHQAPPAAAAAVAGG